MKKWTAKRFISCLLTVVMLVSMFSMVTVASASELDDELAGMINYMITGVNADDWTLSGNNINISNGVLNMHRRSGQTATSVNKYDLSGGFTFSGDFNFTGQGFNFSNSYITIGNLKIEYAVTSGSSPVYFKLYNTDDNSLLATSYSPIADALNGANALNKNYAFTLSNGKFSIKIDGVAVAFGSETNTEVDVSALSFSSANIKIFHGWVGDPGSGTNAQKNFSLYSNFPYSSVADFTAYLSTINNKSEYSDIVNANTLYDIVMANGSDELKAEIEPYGAALDAAYLLTWDDITVTSEDTGSILIDGAAYDGAATVTAGNEYTVTAIPGARYNFAAFVDADGNVLSTEPEYKFTATSATYIKATYIAKIYSNWSITATDGGSINIDGAAIDATAEYEVGTVATIEAVADEGYCFLYWTNDKGEIVSSSASLKITFEDAITYKATFSNNPNDLLDFELSNIKNVLIDTFVAEDWSFTNVQTPTDTNSKVNNDGTMSLSARGNTTATNSKIFDLSEGFNFVADLDFSSWGHKMSGDSYIQIGGLKILIYSTGVSSPVYLKAYNNGTLLATSEKIADVMNNSALKRNYAIYVNKNGIMTVKIDGQTISWDNEAVTVDVSSIDFSSSQVVIFQLWVADNHTKTNVQESISLTQSIPCSTVDEFQNYIDAVDTDDADALATAMKWVNIVRENASSELYSKFDTFNFYKAKYNIDRTEGGSIIENDTEFVNDFKTSNRLAVGTVLNLKAQANSGYTFSHWADADGNIKSYETALTVVLTEQGVSVTAVFAKDTATDGDNVTIYFKNRSNKIVSSITVAYGENVTLPDASLAACYGYTVNGWLVNGQLISTGSFTATETTIISADYTKLSTTYKIIVNDAVNEIYSLYNYNDIVSITFDDGLLGEGEYFGGWVNEDGSIVSYDKNYSFYVGADATISAIVSTVEAESVPTINVTDASLIENGQRASFLTERYVPAGYTYVNAGVIFTAGEYDELTLDTVDNTAIYSRSVSSTSANGQFRQTLGSSTSAELNVSLVAYLTYMDAEGNINTIYSSAYSLTINQQ
ncbi:MAG: hypothetical protein IJO58_02160 [Clostridia bacterium]|nr:hypothetical protein [Clostridia bacterium]